MKTLNKAIAIMLGAAALVVLEGCAVCAHSHRAWEYRMLQDFTGSVPEVANNRARLLEQLNQAGKEGFDVVAINETEPVGVGQNTSPISTIWLKRPAR